MVRVAQREGDAEIVRLLGQARPTDAQGRYLHWHELRRRPSADGEHAETRWLAMKMARAATRRDLPLLQKDGSQFWFTIPDPMISLTHDIDKRSAGMIGFPKSGVSGDLADTFKVNAMMEEAFFSSRIEGAATTRAVAKEMLRENRPPRSHGERMVLNNYNAMMMVREIQNQLISVPLIQELQSVVVAGTLIGDEAPGALRERDDVVVEDVISGEVLHQPPPSNELPARTDALCRFANGETGGAFVHPVVQAIIVHFMMGYDHPFPDGNGRTARALFHWVMARNGYWLIEYAPISRVIDRARVAYGNAFLLSETDEGDLTYFILYHLEVIRRAIDELDSYLTRKAHEFRDVERLLTGSEFQRLNHRQIALLRHAFEHPGGQYSIEGHARAHAVSYQSARSDLDQLWKLGLLEETHRGRKRLFIAPRDLSQRMRGG
ncbi:MAG: Fic family protein [Azospirillaceae bacterium]